MKRALAQILIFSTSKVGEKSETILRQVDILFHVFSLRYPLNLEIAKFSELPPTLPLPPNDVSDPLQPWGGPRILPSPAATTSSLNRLC
mgnify:CR=1 FL=1